MRSFERGCGPGNERRALYRLRAGIVFEYYARCPAYGAASREIVDWLILSSRATSDCVSPISRSRNASSRWNCVSLGRRPSLISFVPNANSSCFDIPLVRSGPTPCCFQPLMDFCAQQAETAICDDCGQRLVVRVSEGSCDLVCRHNLSEVRANSSRAARNASCSVMLRSLAPLCNPFHTCSEARPTGAKREKADFGPRRRLTHEPPFREQALSASDSS